MRTIIHRTALVFSLLFLLSFVVTHLVKKDLDWLIETLSMYALGDNGVIITLGFYCIAVTQLLLSLSLLTDDRYPLRESALLLLCTATGPVLVAYFPVMLPPADIVTQLPHIAGAIVQFLMFPLSALMLSKYMLPGRMKSFSKKTGLITLMLFVIILALFFVRFYREIPFFGLLEKVDILIINFWLIVFSYHCSRVSLGSIFIKKATS